MVIGRFQVMATLQTARAYILGKPLEEAKSWGLNRAIFYAVAKKRGFAGKGKSTGEKVSFKIALNKTVKREIQVDKLGTEKAYCIELNGYKFYVMGDEVQTPEKFEKQIERRFEGYFEKALNEAISICKQYDKEVLLSQSKFFQLVYKPRRDELAKKWSKMVEEKIF